MCVKLDREKCIGCGSCVSLTDQKIFDLIVYFKYYLPRSEYKQFISELKGMLSDLQSKIHPHAFEYVRAQMGIRTLEDLDTLLSFPKNDIEYNKFGKDIS